MPNRSTAIAVHAFPHRIRPATTASDPRASGPGGPAGNHRGTFLMVLALASGVLIASLLTAGPSLSQLSPTGSPRATLTPSRLDFGEASVGGPFRAGTVTVSSTGSADLVVQQAEVVADGPADFSVEPDTCRGTMLPPGSSCELNLAFRPSAEGPREARLVVRTNAGGLATVTLAGTGRPSDTRLPTTVPPLPLPPPPSLRARPLPISPGEPVTATGMGYEGLTQILLDDKPVGSVMADGQGRITHAFTVPNSTSIGQHLLIACDGAPPCGRVVLVTEPTDERSTFPVAAALLALLLLALVAALLALRQWQQRGRPRRGGAKRGCGFTSTPRLTSNGDGSLSAALSLRLDCGEERSVTVDLRDASGRHFVPSRAHMALTTPQGPVEATLEGARSSVDVTGHGPQASSQPTAESPGHPLEAAPENPQSLGEGAGDGPSHRPHVDVAGPWGPIQITVRVNPRPLKITVVGRWGPISLSQPLDRERPQITLTGPWGPLVLAASFDPHPRLTVKGRWGPIEPNVTVDRNGVNFAANVLGQPLDLKLSVDPRNPAVSMNADLGFVDLTCEYRAGAAPVPAEKDEVEVALKSGPTELEQRRAVVRGALPVPTR
jgi:hypothetical protein